jgi:hypothetical protein
MWHDERHARRAVIQHAISNPALAPFLAGGGEYTDQAIYDAWKKAVEANDAFPDRMRAFLASLPRRESPSIAEDIPPADPEPSVWSDPVCGCIRSPYAPKDSPCPICKPAAQVPLGPKDVKPESVLRNAEVCWYSVKYVLDNCVCIDIDGRNTLYYGDLKTEHWQINTSIPDTGRWDANAWRPCSKPAGKEVKSENTNTSH